MCYELLKDGKLVMSSKYFHRIRICLIKVLKQKDAWGNNDIYISFKKLNKLAKENGYEIKRKGVI